ncbi:MAG TPA: tRNA-dihydrouridine synthase family protein [Candidatus Poseidoniales archaeon]|nr:tRNA-dihydrouridine synthase family protein [Candidatus Poseidoniales archaeon]HIL43605.1 tRNA-dihydrouridine synthase family protein [Candidatus Poseidoniales archaeon]
MSNESVPLFLAPMAGVTDLAYRLLARECGADVTVTEFTAASGLTRRNTNSWLKVESDPREKPFIPQIFGGITSEMVETVELLQDRADVIDINFGCPAPKICRNDAGAALLRDPDRVVGMVRACLDVAEVPITVKVRLGTGGGPNTALEVAQRLEAEGIERICVHGRTLRQRYSGEADWQQIRNIVEAVDIPVIANGDVVDATTATACLEATGAAGLMIGRGAIGRPTVFHEIKRDMGWHDQNPPWGSDDPAVARLWCWERYLELSDEVYPTQMNKNLKRHAVSFTKGLPGASAMRVDLHSIQDQTELGSRIAEYLEALAEPHTVVA